MWGKATSSRPTVFLRLYPWMKGCTSLLDKKRITNYIKLLMLKKLKYTLCILYLLYYTIHMVTFNILIPPLVYYYFKNKRKFCNFMVYYFSKKKSKFCNVMVYYFFKKTGHFVILWYTTTSKKKTGHFVILWYTTTSKTTGHFVILWYTTTSKTIGHFEILCCNFMVYYYFKNHREFFNFIVYYYFLNREFYIGRNSCQRSYSTQFLEIIRVQEVFQVRLSIFVEDSRLDFKSNRSKNLIFHLNPLAHINSFHNELKYLRYTYMYVFGRNHLKLILKILNYIFRHCDYDCDM